MKRFDRIMKTSVSAQKLKANPCRLGGTGLKGAKIVEANERIEIVLTREQAGMVRDAVSSGEYASAGEVVREALRLWRFKRASERKELLTRPEKSQLDPNILAAIGFGSSNDSVEEFTEKKPSEKR